MLFVNRVAAKKEVIKGMTFSKNYQLTVVAQEALRHLLVAFGSDEGANDKVPDGHQQDDEQSDLGLNTVIALGTLAPVTPNAKHTYLGLPLHADDDDNQQQQNGDTAYDADVLDAAVDYCPAVGAHHGQHGLAEADHIHGAGHGVRQRKNQANGAAKLRAQRPGYHVIRSTWMRGKVEYIRGLEPL